MQVKQGEIYAWREHHVIHRPPARVLSTDEWYWEHDVWGKPQDRYPLRLREFPHVGSDQGYRRGSKPVASMYDMRGVPVVRLKHTPDPHITLGLHAVQLMQELTMPDLSGDDAVQVLERFEGGLPAELVIGVIATDWCEQTWADYVPRARERWRREKCMQPERQEQEIEFWGDV